VTKPMRRLIAVSIVAVLIAFCSAEEVPVAAFPPAAEGPQSPAGTPVRLPNEKASLKFAVLGYFGTGGKGQYALASEMARFHEAFKFGVVITVGDNLYGSEQPSDFKRKFEDPYKLLLDAGVKFYAVLGNHDARAQRSYQLFNMGGKYYYSFKAPAGRVRFFMLDTTYRVPEETAWIEKELKASSDDWKIAVFHHPIYSSGGRHGSDLKLRETLEPIFVDNSVSVVFAGHDHFYERIKPQHGIVYFVVGSGGQLALGDIDKSSALTAKGFDTDNAFLAVEISGDKMYFNGISSDGRVIDSGIIERRAPAGKGP
jgi:predicted phosphodiesterase